MTDEQYQNLLGEVRDIKLTLRGAASEPDKGLVPMVLKNTIRLDALWRFRWYLLAGAGVGGFGGGGTAIASILGGG